jgi:SAM-dependent methyltransferase
MTRQIDILAYNRFAWDRNVIKNNPWTVPVSPEAIQSARNGQWQILLTPSKPVPPDWFPELKGCQVLCLASGGGQQGPILAAAGAVVSVLDNSPSQLAQDRLVADREGLIITTVLGNMTDLSQFNEQTFDLIVNPVSNVFIQDVLPLWRESFRVLKPGGCLLSGFTNPLRYLFDLDAYENREFIVKYKIPYSDLTSLEPDLLEIFMQKEYPLEFGHTLNDQIGGQIAAGFLIAGFYEDRYPEIENDPLSKYIDTFIASRGIKP